MPTLETITDLIANYRQDKISLALILAVMQDSEEEAVTRLNQFLEVANERANERRKKIRNIHKLHNDFEYKCWTHAISLVNDAKPIIEQIAGLTAPKVSDKLR